jgi:uncharacterized protein (TIGR02594 family)
VTLTPTWLVPAFQELILGVHEIPGPATNDRIAKYLATVGQASDDEIPWCSAFVNFCLQEAGIGGTGQPNARSFVAWGEPTEGKVGAVCVLSRGDPAGWQGHVGFVVGLEPGRVFLLNGNQADSVSVASHHTRRLLGYRWPAGS